MNKLISYTLAAALAFAVLPVPRHDAGTVYAASSPRVVIDGEVIALDNPPILDSGTVYAPLRPILSRLGFEIGWDERTGSATAVRSDLKLSIKPGSPVALVNGLVTGLDAAPRMVDGAVWIPVQPFVKLIGAQTVWNSITMTLFIKPEMSGTITSKLQQEAERFTYEGESRFGLKQGAGKLLLDGQLWYEGQFNNNKLEGLGLLYENGRLVYDGYFENNVPAGIGKLFYPNGDYYYGAFKNGKPNGTGDLISSGKTAYHGEWKNGAMDGAGSLYDSTGAVAYEGEFANNDRNGHGVSYKPTKSAASSAVQPTTAQEGKIDYEGEWKNGKKNGEGRLYGDDGKIVFQGEFKNDQQDGPGQTFRSYKGKFYSLEEKVVVGVKEEEVTEFQDVRYTAGKLISTGTIYNYIGERTEDGIPHGKGSTRIVNQMISSQTGLLASDRSYYEGQYEHGHMTGFGKLYNEKDELVYEGDLIDGKRSGRGIAFKDGVTQYEGGWFEDKMSGIGRTYSYNSDVTFDFEGSSTAILYEGEYSKGSLIKPGSIYKYIGSFKNGKANGYGTKLMLYDSTDETKPSLPLSETVSGKLVYEGFFKDGYYEGLGKLYSQYMLLFEGDFERGYFKEDVKSEYYENNTKYSGTFNSNGRHGFGTVYNQYGHVIYEGEYKDNRKNGRGKQYDENGILQYEGDFRNDERDGYGKLYETDGETTYYEGEFREGKTIYDYIQDNR